MLDRINNFPELKSVLDAFSAKFGSAIQATTFDKDELVVTIAAPSLLDAVRFLKQDCRFNALNDIIGLDNLKTAQPGAPRFSILYLLYRFPGFERLRLKIDVAEGQDVPSITGLYRAADWAEREVYDMFGIRFSGHPHMKRIYMDETWQGHPLRKDYPLEGK
jgi:NADH-quinone oxidoreductase subunit C